MQKGSSIKQLVAVWLGHAVCKGGVNCAAVPGFRDWEKLYVSVTYSTSLVDTENFGLLLLVLCMQWCPAWWTSRSSPPTNPR